MNREVMFSSKTDDWATPREFFDALDKEFHFTLDPCADDTNHKCPVYYTKMDNGLCKPWGGVVCSAILLTGESWESGSKRLTTKAGRGRVLSC